MGLPCGVGCSGSQVAQVGALECFCRSSLEATFFDFWWILGGFLEPKWSPKSIFSIFLNVFFNRDFGIDFFSDFLCFFQIRTLIFVRTASVS